MAQIRAVIDTNVVFEGLTKKSGSSTLILRAWRSGLFRAFSSLALAYEYQDVLARKLSPQRWESVRPVLGVLLAKAYPVTVNYSWRPSSPDLGDEFVIDCAMNASAWVITHNVRDFAFARADLGLVVMSPDDFVGWLAR